jgi:hypothetical protein
MDNTGQRKGRSPKLQHVSEGCVVGTLDDIALVVWTDKPRLEQVLELRRVLEGMRQRYEWGSSVHVLNNKLELPDKRVRDEMARITEDFADRTIASAMVLSGEGFWVSTMRGLATSLHFLASKRRHFQLRVCATTEQAAQWLTPLHNERSRRPTHDGELSAALTELCRRAGPPPQRARRSFL